VDRSISSAILYHITHCYSPVRSLKFQLDKPIMIVFQEASPSRLAA